MMRQQPRGGHIFNIDGAGSDGRPTPRYCLTHITLMGYGFVLCYHTYISDVSLSILGQALSWISLVDFLSTSCIYVLIITIYVSYQNK